jgi:hypothetical protein
MTVHCKFTPWMVAAYTAAVLTLANPSAQATPRYVDRPITLPGSLSGAFDLGVAYGRAGSYDSAGLSFEGTLGIRSALELGLRLGVSSGNGFARADYYARTYDRETFWLLGGRAVANPEFRVRGQILERGAFQLALEGRLLLPVSIGTGVVLGMPLQATISHAVKVESGLYVPIGFFSPRTEVGLNVPVLIMFQVTDHAWLGPSTGLRLSSISGRSIDVPLGLGGGVSLARSADLKGELYFNRLNDGAREFGVGLGVGFLFL